MSTGLLAKKWRVMVIQIHAVTKELKGGRKEMVMKPWDSGKERRSSRDDTLFITYQKE